MINADSRGLDCFCIYSTHHAGAAGGTVLSENQLLATLERQGGQGMSRILLPGAAEIERCGGACQSMANYMFIDRILQRMPPPSGRSKARGVQKRP